MEGRGLSVERLRDKTSTGRQKTGERWKLGREGVCTGEWALGKKQARAEEEEKSAENI